ncbi:MAG: thioesterase [Clostridiales bacterium]|nr:thioesterase [Clostridiales bacterium]
MTEKAKPMYTMQRTLTDTDADFAQRQRLSSMFCMFQDIAGQHAATLGASVAWLREELNLAWILMRVRLEVDKYPVLGQEVTVETWPQAPRALYERDYMIRDMDGAALVRAGSTWIIMDLDTREIKRDKFLDYHGLEMKTDRALGRGVGRLKPVDGMELAFEKEMCFSDTDYNGHVNNAKYVDHIMDCFSFEEHKARVIRAIEMHYVNEIGPGDILQIRRKDLEGGAVYLDGVRKSDGISVINSLVEWGDIA